MSFTESIFKAVAAVKFRFDVGSYLFTIANFGLLIWTNSDRILKVIPLKGEYASLLITLVCGFLGLLFIVGFGEFMLKAGYYKNYTNESSIKNPVMLETLETVRRLEVKMNENKAANRKEN